MFFSKELLIMEVGISECFVNFTKLFLWGYHWIAKFVYSNAFFTALNSQSITWDVKNDNNVLKC